MTFDWQLIIKITWLLVSIWFVWNWFMLHVKNGQLEQQIDDNDRDIKQVSEDFHNITHRLLDGIRSACIANYPKGPESVMPIKTDVALHLGITGKELDELMQDCEYEWEDLTITKIKDGADDES